ncbi:MAG: hypothetical protein M3N95_07455 [Actinomycetota bacterium]|nr:hypothetical protein [Actinomycetota bacterium]
MRLDDHLSHVQEQLAAAAALGDERTQQIATTLASAVTPAVRLAIMSAVSSAADEITAALLDSPGAPVVCVQLDGADIRVDVRASDPAPRASATPDDGDASARISLRLSEALKAGVEGAARREGISVNTWLVREATRALSSAPDTSVPTAGWGDPLRHANSAHRVTGWING